MNNLQLDEQSKQDVHELNELKYNTNDLINQIQILKDDINEK